MVVSAASERIEELLKRAFTEQRKLTTPALTDILFQASAELANALSDCPFPRELSVLMRQIDTEYLRASSAVQGQVYPRVRDINGSLHAGFAFAPDSPYAAGVPATLGDYPYHLADTTERRGLVNAAPDDATTSELLVLINRTP